MDERLLRPLTEASYLTTGNAWRYRAILRYFFLQHESMRHFVYPEEVLGDLHLSAHFASYQEGDLEQDLRQLVDWGNLVARQDTRRVTSVEEFRKKRFRYQATAYAIEIERMVAHLEQMGASYGGSLERTDVDRLLENLQSLVAAKVSANAEDLHGKWTEVFSVFQRFTTNATSYLAALSSERSEALMSIPGFLAYKDSLSDYLRNFITTLQRTSVRIEAVLRSAAADKFETVCEKLADYTLSIPRLEEQLRRDELISRYKLQWRNLCTWFLGSEQRNSDRYQLQLETHEAIRRITRFVQRLGERYQQQRSRRREYLQLAARFANCSTLEEAHVLSACVFGLSETRHLYAPIKDTEDIYAEVWDRPALTITINPRIRNYRPKSKSGAVTGRAEEKSALLAEYLQARVAEEGMLSRIVQKGFLRVAELGIIQPEVRKALLAWITRGLASSEKTGSTEGGRRYRLHTRPGQVTLTCTDGKLLMPDYTLEFME